MQVQAKDEFRNATRGQVGVIVIDGKRDPRGISVLPGNTVWLSEEEQVLTANAPRHEKDNPFVGGNPEGGPALVLVTKAGEVKNRRPIGTAQGVANGNGTPEAAPPKAEKASETKKQPQEPQQKAQEKPQPAERQAQKKKPAEQQAEETAAPSQAAGKAAEGQRAVGEEVGTPSAPEKAEA